MAGPLLLEILGSGVERLLVSATAFSMTALRNGSKFRSQPSVDLRARMKRTFAGCIRTYGPMTKLSSARVHGSGGRMARMLRASSDDRGPLQACQGSVGTVGFPRSSG